jgi:hypothetical protein
MKNLVCQMLYLNPSGETGHDTIIQQSVAFLKLIQKLHIMTLAGRLIHLY